MHRLQTDRGANGTTIPIREKAHRAFLLRMLQKTQNEI